MASFSCSLDGGKLAVLDTLQKWKIIQMDIKGNKELSDLKEGFHVGAKYIPQKEGFYWLNNKPVHRDMLSERAPNSNGKCAILGPEEDGFLIAQYDCMKKLPYIGSIDTKPADLVV
ncbi:uncharacterized protein LOC121377124 isoform X1 [Gigantopelta aegis]|uniref:uncharacterized protein LOC121377124 isoform X1 n=1 Tax=Gigantopelta aegis TaxID=1735272 RepID=UPI001B88D387|nr:uncharacterized protein LOC121377124 isoform X1 [Gigantopelta aegis]